MILSMAPIGAFAAQTAETVIQQTNVGEDLPDNDTLFSMYVDSLFYPERMPSMASTGDQTAYAGLSDDEKTVYDSIMSTIVTPLLKGEFQKAIQKIQIEGLGPVVKEDRMSQVMDAILLDHPYEMFWFNKTKGYSCGYSESATGEVLAGTISMSVAQAYADTAGTNDAEIGYLTPDSSKIAAATKAVQNANTIINGATGTDIEKLQYFKEQICDRVSYDTASATNNSVPYGDPWQMIYVFDNNATTNVVCEGYSKAFQYLCDKAFPNGSVQCYTVTGNMNGGTGAGAHMWNIVRVDGKSYLVDITNCDEGSTGDPYWLFMRGCASGNEQGYTIDIPIHKVGEQYSLGSKIGYTYGEDLLWDKDILTLSKEDHPCVPGFYYENIPETLKTDTKVELSPTTNGEKYSYELFTASLKDTNGKLINAITFPDGLTLNENGTITGIPTTVTDKETSVIIQATEESGENFYFLLTLPRVEQGEGPAVKSVTVTPASTNLDIPLDEIPVTTAFKAEVTYTDASSSAAPSVKWSITPEMEGVSVASDGVTGTVTVTKDAIDAIRDSQEFTVTATSKGISGTAKLTVQRSAPVVTEVTVTGSLETQIPAKGDTAVNFTANVKDQYGDPFSAPVTWKISPEDGNVTIDQTGKVTVKSTAKAGTFTISAICDEKSGTATLVLKKEAPVAASIKFYSGKDELNKTDTIDIPGSKTYTVKVFDQYGAEMQDASVAITASQASAGITFDKGTVTVAKTAAENGSITLTAKVNSVSAMLTVTAKKVPQIKLTLPALEKLEFKNTAAENASEAVLLNAVQTKYPKLTGTNGEKSVELTAKWALTKGTWKAEGGEYTYTATLTAPAEEADKFTWENPTLQVVVTAKDLAQVSFPEETLSKTYDGQPFTNPKAEAKVGKTSLENPKFTYSWLKKGETEDLDEALTAAPKDAGTYEITATLQHDDYDGSATKKVTITPIEVTIVWSELSTEEAVYDGTAKEIAAAVNPADLLTGDTCQVKKVAFQKGEQTVEKMIDAGTYTAIASELSNPNYKASGQATQAYTIAKATRTLTADQTALTLTPNALSGTVGLHYQNLDGSAQPVVSVTGEDASVIRYSLFPEGTEGGNLTVTGRKNGIGALSIDIAETENYTAIAAPVTCEVVSIPEPLLSVAVAGDQESAPLTASVDHQAEKVTVSGVAKEGETLTLISTVYDTLTASPISAAVSDPSAAIEVKFGSDVIAKYDIVINVTIMEDNVALVEGKTDTKVGDAIDASQQQEITAALTNDETKVENLVASAAGSLNEAAKNAVTEDKKAEIEEKVGKDYTLEVKTDVKIEAKSLKKDESAAIVSTTFELDIQPTYTITAKGTKDSVEVTHPVETGDLKGELTTEVTIRVKLPESLAKLYGIYAKHYLDNAKKEFEILPVTVSEGIAAWRQKSFSPTELIGYDKKVGGTVTFQCDNGSSEQRTYETSDLNQELPEYTYQVGGKDYKFQDWKIANTYDKVTEDFLKTIATSIGTVAKSAVSSESPYIELSKDNVSLSQDDTETLSVIFVPENARDQNVTWSSSDSSVVTVETGKVTALKAGTATITAETNGQKKTCAVTVKASSSGNTPVVTPGHDSDNSGGNNSNGGGGGGNTSHTITRPNGDKVTTKTDLHGTKTETTRHPDGSVAVVETKKDGTKTTTDTAANGDKIVAVLHPDGSRKTTMTTAHGNSVTDVTSDGKTTAKVSLSSKSMQEASKNHQTVSLPLPVLSAGTDSAKAPIVAIDTAPNTTVKVKIPVESPNSGTVAILVHPDGTEEIVKTSVATDDGLLLHVSDDVTVKVLDNTKMFTDVTSANNWAWAKNSVDFVSARELFKGTSNDTFSPEMNMTRSMLVTVLFRLDGEQKGNVSSSFADVAADTWYTDAVAWASTAGVVKGVGDNSFAPDLSINRESMCTMLYRYAQTIGFAGASGSLDAFHDAETVSSWASDAVSWCVGTGIITGKEGKTLDPQGTATRAEVATMLQRLVSQNQK